MEEAFDVGGRRAAENAAGVVRHMLETNGFPDKVAGMFHYTDDAIKKALEQAETARKAYEKYKQGTDEQAGVNLFGTLNPQVAGRQSDKAAMNAFGNLGAWTNGKWSDIPSNRAGRDASQNFGISGPVYPRGGDTTVTINVTAGASAPEIANTVKKVVESMVAFQKTSNGWTFASGDK